MKNSLARLSDELIVASDRPRGEHSLITLEGFVLAQMYDEEMRLKAEVEVHNLITTVGDVMYAHRGAGIATPPNAPTGMKLGTGSTAPAKTGAGAALVTYLTGSQKAFDGTFPSIAGNVVTYRCTYAPGEATTASAITEAVIVNETLANATSAAAATISRALITGVGAKQAGDTLILTWTHTATGA